MMSTAMQLWCDENNESYYSSGSEQTVKMEDDELTLFSSDRTKFVESRTNPWEAAFPQPSFHSTDAQSRLPLPFSDCPLPLNNMSATSLAHTMKDDWKSPLNFDDISSNILATFEAEAVRPAQTFVPPPAYFDFGKQFGDMSTASVESPPSSLESASHNSLELNHETFGTDSTHLNTAGNDPSKMYPGVMPLPPSILDGDSLGTNLSNGGVHPLMDVDAHDGTKGTALKEKQETQYYSQGFGNQIGFGVVPSASILPPPVLPFNSLELLQNPDSAEETQSSWNPSLFPLRDLSPLRVKMNSPDFTRAQSNQTSSFTSPERHQAEGHGWPGFENIGNTNMSSYDERNSFYSNYSPGVENNGLFVMHVPYPVPVPVPNETPLEPSGIVSAQVVPRDPNAAVRHYQQLLLEKMKDDNAPPEVVKALESQFQAKDRPSVLAGSCAGDSKRPQMMNKGKLNGQSQSPAASPSDVEGQFTCNVCQKKYKTEKYLRAHAKVHSPLAPSCDVCGKKFATPDKVRRHRTIHTGEKPFQCDFCERAFNRKEHLTKHRRVHTGEKPYICPTCNRGFTQKGNLSSHLKIHTGERPFRCDLCPKAFRLKSHLITHTRTHTGEKPFSCDHCAKRFSDQSSLSRHRRLHIPGNKYKCSTCDKEFTDVSNVRRHQRIAHGAAKQNVANMTQLSCQL